MTHRISLRSAALAGALTLLAVLVAMALPAPPASASPYCGGQVLSNYAYCYGAARSMTGTSGYGDQHSVCVGAASIWGGCSTGPGNIKSISFGGTINGQPWIEDNAAGSTVVHGDTF